eukprot:359303-Chlamydomonas_euryale.AAC.5
METFALPPARRRSDASAASQPRGCSAMRQPMACAAATGAGGERVRRAPAAPASGPSRLSPARWANPAGPGRYRGWGLGRFSAGPAAGRREHGAAGGIRGSAGGARA